MLKKNKNISLLALLIGAGFAIPVAHAQSSGDVVTQPIGRNTESVTTLPPVDGLSISIDGDPLFGEPDRSDQQRRADVALEKADIQVRFDGLTVEPGLNLSIIEEQATYSAGDRVTFSSASNFPAFIDRGELQIIDLDALGGPKVVQVVALAPNDQVGVTLPNGNLAATYRVFDVRGRFNETRALTLRRIDGDAGLRGGDITTKRNIPIVGGAVTVSGSQVGTGATVRVMGEDVATDPSGRFAVQRILPVGSHGVDVSVSGTGMQPVDITRDITIPNSEAFYLAVVDLTYQTRTGGVANTDDAYATGRVSGYWNGRTAGGTKITASVDTGEGNLDTIFRDIYDKDPRNLALRVSPSDLYPTYGDGSTLVDTTPTAGKFYLNVEKNGNSFTWGTYRADVSGGTYLRNERTLYGATANLQTQSVTENGDARARLQLYAAQPENLPGRDVFRGTGGSVYFLQRQDISVASETLTIEVRNAATGLVVERIPLVAGRDYDINYIQGLITLSEPLSGSSGGGSVISSASGDYDVNLIAQYEYTPTSADADAFSYGLRAEAWPTDQLRVGVTGQVEKTDLVDQQAYGADILYRLSDNTYVELDYAQSKGPGFGSGFSTDGGFVIDNSTPTGGQGQAYRLNIKADFADLGLSGAGALGAYAERRTEGFSTLDYQTLGADEDRWGVFVDAIPNDRLSYSIKYDSFENSLGSFDRTGTVELSYAISDTYTVDFGVEHLNADTGSRTDAGARLTYSPSEDASLYIFGQTTLDRDGLDRNDRFGIGGAYGFAAGWEVEGEIYDSSIGLGGKAQLGYSDDAGTSSYFGYELTPEREYSGVTLSGQDRGHFIAGGTRKVNERLSYFGENTYDIFGENRSLSSAYGVTYSPDQVLTYTANLEFGRVQDDINGDFDRNALSFGVRYDNSENIQAEGRIEFRQDRGDLTGSGNQDLDALLVNGSLRYKIDVAQRVVVSLLASKTESNGTGIIEDGELVDASIGYALRPVRDDKLNVLLKYRFLRDMYGQVIDGSDELGPRQQSHVFSVDADYDLNQNWTIGGKLGIRLAETAADGASNFVENNAYLGLLNARYHLVHNWDVLLEVRALTLEQAQTTEIGALGAVYRHLGNNVKVGVG